MPGIFKHSTCLLVIFQESYYQEIPKWSTSNIISVSNKNSVTSAICRNVDNDGWGHWTDIVTDGKYNSHMWQVLPKAMMADTQLATNSWTFTELKCLNLERILNGYHWHILVYNKSVDYWIMTRHRICSKPMMISFADEFIIGWKWLTYQILNNAWMLTFWSHVLRVAHVELNLAVSL